MPLAGSFNLSGSIAWLIKSVKLKQEQRPARGCFSPALDIWVFDDQEMMDDGEMRSWGGLPCDLVFLDIWCFMETTEIDVEQIPHNNPVICFKKRDESLRETDNHGVERRLHQEQRRQPQGGHDCSSMLRSFCLWRWNEGHRMLVKGWMEKGDVKPSYIGEGWARKRRIGRWSIYGRLSHRLHTW